MKPDFELFVLARHRENAVVYVNEKWPDNVDPVTLGGNPVDRYPASQIMTVLRLAKPEIKTVQLVGAESRRPRTLEEFDQWLNDELSKD